MVIFRKGWVLHKFFPILYRGLFSRQRCSKGTAVLNLCGNEVGERRVCEDKKPVVGVRVLLLMALLFCQGVSAEDQQHYLFDLP